jgi:hypothetical protein
MNGDLESHHPRPVRGWRSALGVLSACNARPEDRGQAGAAAPPSSVESVPGGDRYRSGIQQGCV